MTIGSSFAVSLAALRTEIDRLGRVGDDVARLGAAADPARTAVELIRVETGVRANAAVVRTADETLGALLDTVG